MPLTEEMEPKAHMHPGFEFLYVLEGELELRHGEQDCTLEAGDAVYFDASTPHSYQCAGQEAGRGDYRDHAPAAVGDGGSSAGGERRSTGEDTERRP